MPQVRRRGSQEAKEEGMTSVDRFVQKTTRSLWFHVVSWLGYLVVSLFADDMILKGVLIGMASAEAFFIPTRLRWRKEALRMKAESEALDREHAILIAELVRWHKQRKEDACPTSLTMN